MATLSPLVSQQAEVQDRNVFLWYTYGPRIGMSWRMDDDNQVTAKTMYRWVDAVAKDSHYQVPLGGGAPYIYPIDVTRKLTPVSYTLTRMGPVLSRESMAVVAAGHYGMFEPDGTPAVDLYRFQNVDTHKNFSFEMNSLKRRALDLFTYIEVSPPTRDFVLRRDQSCMLTGTVPLELDALEVSWILPPHLCSLFEANMLKRQRLAEAIHEPETFHLCQGAMQVTNCLTLTKDITVLFRENKIGIDVDDNYKIICFDKRDERTKSLKPYLALPHVRPDGPGDEFLRMHFVRCLIMNACGGDLRDDLPIDGVEQFLADVDYGECDSDGIELPMNEKSARWNEPLGRKVHSWLQAQKS